jgi:hypothetical protein
VELMPTTLLWIAACLFGAGMGLLIRGLRGRRVDDHPICRYCGFDLIGLPTGATKCSECGVNIRRRGAIRVGHRRRRPAVAAAGLLLMSPTILGVALVAWLSFNHIKWIEKAPLWYVARQARSTDPTERDPALIELRGRIAAGRLKIADVKPLTDDVLATQADASKPWSPLQGDFIEAAWSAGLLSVEDRKRYFIHAPQFALTTRAQVRRGDDLPVSIIQQGARSGSAGTISGWAQIVFDPSSDLIAVQHPTIGRFGIGALTPRPGWSSTSHLLKLDPQRIAAAADGTQRLRVDLKLDLMPGNTVTAPSSAPFSTTLPLETTWQLVPTDTVTVRPIDNATQGSSVEHSATVSITTDSLGVGVANVYVNLSIRQSFLPLAHQIVLRDHDGHEWPIYGITMGPSTPAMSCRVPGSVRDFDPDFVYVILRPDPQQAMRTVDIHDYWGGEAVIPDVPVRYQTPRSARPAWLKQVKPTSKPS